MVASGVPRRNGQRHAVSITDMALDLVEVSHSFVIPHMPNEPLKIRVGLHSGKLLLYDIPTFPKQAQFVLVWLA